jgi:DNA (cytosine-5)-methyltransferase 1
LTGYLKALQELRPRSFLLENVPGLAFGVHRAALDLILETASGFGYSCTHGKLNAADFGVPQIRERYFVLGSLQGPISLPQPTHYKLLPGALPIGDLRPWRTAGDVLADLDTEANADDEGHYAGGRYHELLEQIPPGDNYLFFTAKRGHPEPIFEWRKRYWSFLLKLSPDLPAWTIQARRSNNMGPFHWRNRILRISEIMRLQTFPDDWHLAGRIEEQWRQVGNAVPPVLAEAVGASIRRHLSMAVAA